MRFLLTPNKSTAEIMPVCEKSATVPLPNLALASSEAVIAICWVTPKVTGM